MLLETRRREHSWRGDTYGVAHGADVPPLPPARLDQRVANANNANDPDASDHIASSGGDQRPYNAGAAGGAGQVARLLSILLPPS